MEPRLDTHCYVVRSPEKDVDENGEEKSLLVVAAEPDLWIRNTRHRGGEREQLVEVGEESRRKTKNKWASAAVGLCDVWLSHEIGQGLIYGEIFLFLFWSVEEEEHPWITDTITSVGLCKWRKEFWASGSQTGCCTNMPIGNNLFIIHSKVQNTE